VRTPRSCLLCLASLALLSGSAVAGPTVTFLTPSQYQVTQGQPVEMRFVAGAAANAAPTRWPSEQIRWMYVHGGGVQQNRHVVRPERDSEDFVKVTADQPGLTAVGIDQRPVMLEMTGAELRTFVQQHVGNRAVLEKAKALKDDEKLRVRYVASAKTFVRATSARPVPSLIATAKTAQAVELRCGLDPTATRVGSDLPVTPYIDGVKREGIKIQATQVATGKTSAYTEVGSGTGYFRLSDAGVWRVEFDYAEPLAQDATADWAIYSGTLTFEVAKGAGQ
jgi:hypothetical protein